MQKGFALTANFSEFCMSQARIIGPEFVTLEKSICSAWQPASPFAEHRRDDQPHFTHKCMLLLVKDANSRTSYSDIFFWQHGHPAATSRVVTSKLSHKSHQLVPCWSRGWCNGLRDKKFNTAISGSLRLSPLSRGCIDKTNELRFSESAQMCSAKQQCEAQRAKRTARDANSSAWLLWKQALWVVRNGCRHHLNVVMITQYTSSVCAWY